MSARLVSLTAVALLSVSAARADVVLDTYNGFANDGSGGYGLSNGGYTGIIQSFALPSGLTFSTPSVTLDLGSINSSIDPTGAGSLVVTVSTDANSGALPTAPGTVLQTVSMLDSSLGAGLDTFTFSASMLNAVSSANGEYWVTVDFTSSNTANSGALINLNAGTAGAGIGLTNQLTDTIPTVGGFATSANAFEMIVDTPEPASIAVLGAAMAGLGYIRRRRSATKA